MRAKDISIIIPVIDESSIINQSLEALKKTALSNACEIIVVDGDSSGSTIHAITEKNIKKIKGPRGRGAQMNSGARIAGGRILLFLHADTLLPVDAMDHVIFACNRNKIVGGAFDLEIDSDRFIYRLIDKIASIRSRLTRIPYGDQAIFMIKKTFIDIGGFKKIPIMEDIDLMRRIKHAGHKIHFIPEPVKTSARRWENEGIVFCTIRNILLSTMFYLGVPPKSLKKWYK
ncbi:MAG: glycosyltransferase family 2 protein [Desulfobacteraceae bacterium]|nr:TIGR04283 family arsenosugar biosynthesis glycosyltransferase [Desulfobacteraceae bacterium]MBC2755695.1 glycosyltransferase family 2 protein [Desulfobacteraceae bacterium]